MKSKMVKVMIMVWKMNPRMGALSKLKMVVVKCVISKMMATFRKLMPMRIVANSRWGVFNNRRIFLSCLVSLSSSWSSVCGSSEKKATSEAEITAEMPSNTMLTISEIMAEAVAG